ncbi:hypothetical protein B9Z55_015840 [Caenorhabditis nigoni]|uniref:Uncharacterized protein n=1 Tax=Caenorhabditis nigoni TaxID=1611254 RepID=A0A2G5UBY8_9PELO|nr:hypothetical protein B9Z55_015840 [Caenorhabditis nigoni]
MQLTEEEFAQQEYNEGFWCWYWSNCLEVLGRDKKANSSLSVVTVIEVDNQDESSGSETDVEPSALNESDSSQESTREKIGNLRLAGKDEVTKKSIGIPASLNPEMWESDSD